MNAQRYLFLLLRYLWLILLILATGLAGAWMWLKNQSPVYASRAVLEVIVDQAQVINITDVNSNRITGLDALNTVVQSLTSNTILLQVAQATGLAEEWAQQSAGGKVTPEMESALAGTVRLKLNVGLRRGTRLIDIVAEDSSPEKAQKLAESLVKVFLANQSQSRTDVTTQANSFLVEEANKLKRKVEESETKLAEYRTKNDAISLDERQNVVEQRLQALRSKSRTPTLRARRSRQTWNDSKPPMSPMWKRCCAFPALRHSRKWHPFARRSRRRRANLPR